MVVTTAVLVLTHAAEVARPEGPSTRCFIFITIGVAAILQSPPPVATREDVLDALIRRKLVRQATPRGRQRAAVQVMDLGCIPWVFGDIRGR